MVFPSGCVYKAVGRSRVFSSDGAALEDLGQVHCSHPIRANLQYPSPALKPRSGASCPRRGSVLQRASAGMH